MNILKQSFFAGSRQPQAFTLVESVIASGLAALAFGSILYGYVVSARNSEWSAHSLAAQSMAVAKMEQTRAARWDPTASPVVDDLVSTNFVDDVRVLDVPTAGTNAIYATNFTMIDTVSTSPPLRKIKVRCVWRFANERLYTNDIITYRAPDA